MIKLGLILHAKCEKSLLKDGKYTPSKLFLIANLKLLDK